MKLLILESVDCLGKNSLIKSICDYFEYDNVSIRHFSAPLKELNNNDKLNRQFVSFLYEADLLDKLKDCEYYYYENIIIYNRSYLGEYVYSQMFRGVEKNNISDLILEFESEKILKYNPKLIMLTATPEFCLEKEDGKSFSQNLEQKKKELELFDEVFELTKIKDKLKIKVDNFGRYIPKEDIKNEVIKFIK